MITWFVESSVTYSPPQASNITINDLFCIGSILHTLLTLHNLNNLTSHLPPNPTMCWNGHCYFALKRSWVRISVCGLAILTSSRISWLILRKIVWTVKYTNSDKDVSPYCASTFQTTITINKHKFFWLIKYRSVFVLYLLVSSFQKVHISNISSYSVITYLCHVVL